MNGANERNIDHRAKRNDERFKAWMQQVDPDFVSKVDPKYKPSEIRCVDDSPVRVPAPKPIREQATGPLWKQAPKPIQKGKTASKVQPKIVYRKPRKQEDSTPSKWITVNGIQIWKKSPRAKIVCGGGCSPK